MLHVFYIHYFGQSILTFVNTTDSIYLLANNVNNNFKLFLRVKLSQRRGI